MSLDDLKGLWKAISDKVPPHVQRLIAGGVALGLVLMLFLKVVDEVFEPAEQTLTWVAIPVTAVFAALLCIRVRAVAEWCIHFSAGAIVIFAVGLTSNNVIAAMRHDLGLSGVPDPVRSFEQIMADTPVNGG